MPLFSEKEKPLVRAKGEHEILNIIFMSLLENVFGYITKISIIFQSYFKDSSHILNWK